MPSPFSHTHSCQSFYYSRHALQSSSSYLYHTSLLALTTQDIRPKIPRKIAQRNLCRMLNIYTSCRLYVGRNKVENTMFCTDLSVDVQSLTLAVFPNKGIDFFSSLSHVCWRLRNWIVLCLFYPLKGIGVKISRI